MSQNNVNNRFINDTIFRKASVNKMNTASIFLNFNAQKIYEEAI